MSLTTCLYNDNKISIKDFHLIDDKNKRNYIQCICCNTKLIAKLGQIKMHHFAHENKIECDSFRINNTMTFWHQYWQSFVDTKYFEYVIIKDGVKHIADIYNPDKNLVIEIQHSNITPTKIKEREDFYDNMIWLIDETIIHCDNCKNELCKNCEYYIKICDKCKQKNCCNNKIIGLLEGENFLIIKNINNPFFLSATKPVFLHVEKYILKFIRKLDNNYILCEIIKMKNFILEYFPFPSNYKIKEIVKSINHLYNQYQSICNSFSGFSYILENDKIIIPCILDDINGLTESGFKLIKKRNEYVYFFNRNQSYCNKCNLNLTIGTELCNNCYSNSKDCFTNNWYNIFFNNKICKKMISHKYCEIELNIKEPIIIKTRKDNEINITNTIIIMDEINMRNENINLTIYFVDDNSVNYKDVEVDKIEKITIYNDIFYRIIGEYTKGNLLDICGKNLYLTLYFDNYKYTYLEPIKRNNEFLKELSKITNQELKWNIEPLKIKYNTINYDELLEKEDDRVKIIFYCIEFRIYEIDYYRIIGLLGIYSKNKIILELFLKWLDKFRDDSNDYKIDFGKYKGKYYYELPYDYLLWLKKEKLDNFNNFVYNKNFNEEIKNYKLHLLQHPEKCKEIFNNKEKQYNYYIDYFNAMEQKFKEKILNINEFNN